MSAENKESVDDAPEPAIESDVARPDGEPEDFLVGAESDMDPTLSVVLPTLNEEKGIKECIGQIKQAVNELEVTTEIIVSDSSTDRTPEIARERGAIVVEPDKPGYGYAYRYAFERARGEYIGMGDADTTYDFTELPKLYQLVAGDEADIAMGSRLEGEIKSGAMPALHQYVGNPFLTRFLNVFYDADVSDAHSGLRVFDAEAFSMLDLQSDGMEFASEMIMEAAENELTIKEIPITYHQRRGEATLESFSDGWRHTKFMLINAPTYLFTAPALAFTGIGLAIVLLSALRSSFGGITFQVQTMFVGSLLTIVGFQVGSLSVFSMFAANPIKKPSDPVITWIMESFRLEHGILLGAGFVAFGGGYVVFMVWRWVTSGFTKIPIIEWNIVAFTAIVIGVQLLFQSFFLSLISDK